MSKNSVVEAAKKIAVQAEPSAKLSDMLNLKNVTKLREIAKLYSVKKYTKMEKEELISSITEAMKDTSLIKEIVSNSAKEQKTLFNKIAKADTLSLKEKDLANIEYFMNYSLVQLYIVSDEVIAVVSEDVKAALASKAKTTKTKAEDKAETAPAKTDKELLKKYLKSAVNLYGALATSEFVSIYNFLTKQAITEKDVTAAVKAAKSEYFSEHEGYVVYNEIIENHPELLKKLMGPGVDRARFVPGPNEFLRYEDPNYYERTPHTNAIFSYLNSRISNKAVADHLANAICVAAASGAGANNLVDMLVSAGFNRIAEVAPLLGNLSNHSRSWDRKGMTRAELNRRLEAAREAQRANAPKKPQRMTRVTSRKVVKPVLPVVSGDKVGRNDPCPCGSGKKYKKCCGDK